MRFPDHVPGVSQYGFIGKQTTGDIHIREQGITVACYIILVLGTAVAFKTIVEIQVEDRKLFEIEKMLPGNNKNIPY